MIDASKRSSHGRHTDADLRLAHAMEEYLREAESGHPPNRTDFLSRHSDIADELQGALDGLDFLTHVSPQINDELLGASLTESTGKPVSLGDFVIRSELGRGGMGVVYEAEQLSLGRRVALKVLTFGSLLDPRQLERFKNEARAAAVLKHPSIVGVFQVGYERGVHFYAMDLIDGPSLAHVIDHLRNVNDESTSHRFPTNRPESETCPVAQISSTYCADRTGYFQHIAELFLQVAEALQFAHERAVIHRDIKPSNLLLDETGKAWITDFGLAQVQGHSNLTVTGDLIGTLRYMSPEQASGRGAIDHRSDIYSLGISLYETVTLHPAFSGSGREDVLREVLDRHPIKPRQHDQDIPQDLETIIRTAIEKEPESRYATAGDFADDLRRFITHEPIRARGRSRLRTITSWCRRNRAVSALLSLICALVIFLAVASTIVAIKQASHFREMQHMLYVADMVAAYSEWQSGRIDQVESRLRRHARTPSGQVQSRFEWQLLSNQLRRLKGAESLNLASPVTSVSFSSDNHLLATACWDGTVKIWDDSAKRQVIVSRKFTNVACGRFSPIEDEIFLVGLSDGSIVFWNIESDETERTFSGHTGSITGLTALKGENQNLLASSCTDGLVIVWNLANGQIIQKWQHQSEINDVDFSPDSGLLAAVGADQVVRVWNSSMQLIQQLELAYPGLSLAFARDGSSLAVGRKGYAIEVWETSGWTHQTTLRHESHTARSLVFAHDNRTLVSGGWDNQVCVWDVVNQSHIATYPGHDQLINSVDGNSNTNEIASGGRDGIVRLNSISLNRKQSADVGDLKYGSVRFSPDGRTLIAATGLFSAQSAKPDEGLLRLFDLSTGEVHTLARQTTSLLCADFSSDGRTIVTGGGQIASDVGELQFWDVEHMRRLVEVEEELDVSWSTGRVGAVDYSPDGRFLAVGGGMAQGRGELKVWDLGSRTVVIQDQDINTTISVAFSPNSRLVAVAEAIMNNQESARLRVWDVLSRQIVKEMPAHRAPIYSVAFSPDGMLLASAGGDESIRIWNTKDWTLDSAIRSHMFGFIHVAFTPDGKTLATCGDDATLRLLDLKTRKEICRFKHSISLHDLAFTQNGAMLAALDANTNIRLWHASPGRIDWPVRLP